METSEPHSDRVTVTFDTSAIPRNDRFESWREFSRNAILSHDFIAKADRFSGCVSVVAQTGMSIVRMNEGPCAYIRNPDKANDSQPDLLALYFVLSGGILIEQDGQSTAIRAGDGTVCVGDRPYRLHTSEEHSLLAFKVPRALLSGATDLQGVTARSFLETHNVAPMAIDLAHGIWNRIPSLNTTTTHRLTRTLIDMMETTLGLFLFEEGSSSTSVRQSTLRRIKLFVEQNISNEDLNPLLVSQAFKLSTRYMNRLFNEEGTALARYIWETRLEKAAQRLADPVFSWGDIASIAFSLGFKNQSHFSAAFREKYGVSPTEFRKANFQRHR